MAEVPTKMFTDSNPAAKLLKELDLSHEVLPVTVLGLLQKLPRTERTKYGKRKNLSAEERSELTKKRNREHARATRQRKKMISEALDTLQKKLETTVDSVETDMVGDEERKVHRLTILKAFFEHCGCNSSGSESQVATPPLTKSDVMTEDIKLSSPTLPSRSWEGLLTGGHIPVVTSGIQAITAEAASLPIGILDMLKPDDTSNWLGGGTGGGRSLQEGGEGSGDNPKMKKMNTGHFPFRDKDKDTCSVRFEVDEASVLAVADKIMCNWTLHVELAGSGINTEGRGKVSVRGMAKARFDHSSEKLAALDLRWNVMALAQGLEKLAGRKLVDCALHLFSPSVPTRGVGPGLGSGAGGGGMLPFPMALPLIGLQTQPQAMLGVGGTSTPSNELGTMAYPVPPLLFPSIPLVFPATRHSFVGMNMGVKEATQSAC